MTLKEVSKTFLDVLRTRCDELLIDQTRLLDGNAGMLREIRWRYRRYTFWVEYMHFEAPGNRANILLKDVVIPLKLKVKTGNEEHWTAYTVMEEFLEGLGRLVDNEDAEAMGNRR